MRTVPWPSQAQAVIDEPTERLELPDGRLVDVRPLERRDRQLLAAAIRRLSANSRYLRFASPKRRLTERELDRLETARCASTNSDWRSRQPIEPTPVASDSHGLEPRLRLG